MIRDCEHKAPERSAFKMWAYHQLLRAARIPRALGHSAPGGHWADRKREGVQVQMWASHPEARDDKTERAHVTTRTRFFIIILGAQAYKWPWSVSLWSCDNDDGGRVMQLS